jgi:hypothetical protein
MQQKRKLEAIDRQVKPPMVGPPSMKNEPATLLPGGITYVADTTGQSFRPALEVRLDLSALGHDIAEVQGRVKEAFYANLFLMLAESDRREITAREIDERREEKMLMLGPVLERLHDELLHPLVERVFNIMARNDQLPPPPGGMDLAEFIFPDWARDPTPPRPPQYIVPGVRCDPQSGPMPMARQYLPLSNNRPDAVAVGRRKHPQSVILSVKTAEAATAGLAFNAGNDKVWLADGVPWRFIVAQG